MMVLRVTGDLIGDACDRLAELVPALDMATVQKLETELRLAYGGSEAYIPQKRPPPRGPITPDQVSSDEPVSRQAASLGVSRQHLYRLLNRKKQRGGLL
jgi:hypothetical protein